MGTRRALPPAGQRTNLTTPPRQQGPRAPGYAAHSADRTGRPDRAAPRRSRQQNPRPLRGGRVLRPRALPLPGSGTSAAPAPRSVRVMPPQRGPRPDTGPTRRLPLHRPRMPSVSRPYGPKNEGTGENRSWTSSAAGRQPRPPPNTHHQHPGRQRNPSRVVAGCLYEAGFSTTRSTSAGRRRHCPQHRRRPATARRHADLLRPGRGRRRRHHRLHPNAHRRPVQRDRSPSCSPTSTPAPPTAPSTPTPSPASPPRRMGGGET